MIYYLVIVAFIITLLFFRKKRELDRRFENKSLFYFFLKNSLEFLVPLVIVTGFYAVLLLFVSAAAGRATLGFLEQLEKTLLKINAFYSSYIKLSVTQVIIILAALYVAGLFLISADTSKKVSAFFAKGRLWIRRIYVLIVLLCSFTFFGIQPGEPATVLSVHIKSLREGYANLRKQTRDAISKEVANQLINRIENGLPPSYHHAISLVGTIDSQKSDLHDYYAKAQNEYSIKNGAVESVLGRTTQSEGGVPGKPDAGVGDEKVDVKSYEGDASQINDSRLKSAEAEIKKAAPNQPAVKFEFPNQEGAKRLVLEVPKIFSGKVKSALFSSMIGEHPLLGPIVDSLFATADDKFKQEFEETIDRATGSVIRNPETAQQVIHDETSRVVNQTDIRIPQEAINKSARVNTELETQLTTIQHAKAKVNSEITQIENGRADKLIAQLHSSRESDRESAAQQLSQMGDKLSKEKVDALISTMRRGGQTWSKFLYREEHCSFYERTSVKYYAADALQRMKSPYVNEQIAQEASRSKDTSTTTQRVMDAGWI